MKYVIWGDVHGRAYPKLIIQQNPDADVFISLGDDFDSHDIPFEEQVENFRWLIKYKEANPERLIMLIGNHNAHYLPFFQNAGDRYSGFQSRHAATIGHLLQANKELLQMAYSFDRYLCTHAGVTKTWLNWALEKSGLVYPEPARTYTIVCDLFKYKPQLFLFNGNNPYGDDVTQSPIWVRPQSLNEDATDHIHVVGHTSMKRIATEPVAFRNGGKGFFIDTLGTSGEYLIVEDGVTSIGNVRSNVTYTE